MNEYFLESRVPPRLMDALWAQGWRHFGAYFFRYSKTGQGDVMPLRMRLAEFRPSTSQRRVLRRHADLEYRFGPAHSNAEAEELFAAHKVRFEHNVPDSLYTFIDRNPAEVPCECLSLTVRQGGRLVGMSYLDVGEWSSSSVYQFFDPALGRRSLGIFMILKCVEYSLERGLRLYYPGYAYRQPSHYDYKKRLGALEYLDWEGGWVRLST
ncbi:MAG: GNAT family N-acetyltransferase [Meiothermus sp.]|nr:GNAT family N-acetyltransferase [Meiothermus sp.]